MPQPRRANLTDLLDGYDAVLLDAFGVLVHAEGVIEGAIALIEHLDAINYPYLVVTNDASRHPTRISAWYAELGLRVPPERIITSGTMIVEYFAQRALAGAEAVVLGTEDSHRYVKEAGARVVALDWESDAEVLAVCDDHGFDFLESIDRAVTMLYRRVDRGLETHLLLPNPDLLYPRGEGRFGFTAGAIALLLEAALVKRFPDRDDLRFIRLGKPDPMIFRTAMGRLGTPNVLMVGDQLETDVRGAHAAGLDAALVATGLGEASRDFSKVPANLRPEFILDAIAPGRR